MTKHVLTEIQFYEFYVCALIENVIGSLGKVVFYSIALVIWAFPLMSECEFITGSTFGST